jgi:hypothetical protein
MKTERGAIDFSTWKKKYVCRIIANVQFIILNNDNIVGDDKLSIHEVSINRRL